ncbi:MAG: cytochrome d ubiquinol oxidase subunit II [Bacteroidales bacterium]|jgi:cytochrome d ubiquinol oxidase subunit II|nr:cytochrome d ubiquinol oxidase subunit II [Bacteroidales bacterium]
MSFLTLQHYWFILVSILGALLVFLLYVQGGQTLIRRLGKTPIERDILIGSLGSKWEFTFTTLVTFGGAFFASFPLFYSTSFGGAYWVWILILFCFIIQSVAYEFRNKANNFLGAKTYETFLFINGLLGTILLGTAVATFFTGSLFEIIQNENGTISSIWRGPARGLELAFDFTRYETFINLSLGLAVFCLARILGALYFINNVDNENIVKRAVSNVKITAIPFLIFFLFFLINILVKDGFAYNENQVFMEPYKYLHNLIEVPIIGILLLIGVVLVLAGIFLGGFKASSKGIWFAGIGTILTVFALLLTAGFNNTCYYPAYGEYLQSSINIENSSSSRYTLVVMSYVSLMIPFVFAYIWYAWRQMNKRKINASDVEEGH